MEMRFDPMTGKPIQNETPQMRFDPMTGEPLSESNITQGKKRKEKKQRRKLGKGHKALIIVAAVLAICVISVAGVLSGTFLGKSGKVALATANTLMESASMLQNIDNWDINEASNAEGVELASLTLQPMEDLPVWTNYTASNNGLLDDMLRQSCTQDSIDSLNEICDALYNAASNKDNVITLAKAFRKEYKTLDFEAVGTEMFEIDGKDCRSKGYRTTVDATYMKQMVDDIENLADGDFDRYFGNDVDVDELFESCRNMMDKFPDTDITFYIYKNKLACIELEFEHEDIQIVFHGGRTRMQNMEIIENNETVTKIRARG